MSLALRLARGVLATLEDYIDVAQRRADDPYPLLKLQVHLLEDLILWEDAVSNYKKQKQAATLAKDEKLVAALDGEILIHQNHLRALRDIGDGIAWRLFRHDRSILYTLGDRPGRKHIDLVGIQAEALEFEKRFDRLGSVSVLNDLTHCLKLGDVTTRNSDDSFEIAEVKTLGKKGGRITRQCQAMREAVTLINLGAKDEDGEHYEIRLLDLQPKTFFHQLEALLRRCEADGAAWEKFGEHLIVSGIDATCVEDAEAVLKITGAAKEAAEAWEKSGDDVGLCLSTKKYESVRNSAPYSIFPIPELTRAKLATGALMLFQHLNISALFRLFEARGWTIVKPLAEYAREAGEDSEPQFAATLQKDGFTIQVPWTWIGRVWVEFLQPETIVEMLELLRTDAPKDPVLITTQLSREHAIWQ